MREMAVATREVKLHHCALLPFFMDLAPIGSNLLPNMRKALESCVHADYEEMIARVMGMQDMLEIFYFKECLRAWVKSFDKFGNMNDDYIDKHFLSLSYIVRSISFETFSPETLILLKPNRNFSRSRIRIS